MEKVGYVQFMAIWNILRSFGGGLEIENIGYI
jgi:hypothetical protein